MREFLKVGIQVLVSKMAIGHEISICREFTASGIGGL